ncbi:MAG: hypothetical protein HUJ25_05610 [Crocinitomicaceae bacterium]|nr:hypothetical protein [Crocinitomicaceae bacterium]
MKTYYILLSLLFFVACSTDPNKEDTTEESTTTQSLTEDEVAADLEGLTLNNGQKWLADRSTDEGMRTVQQMLDNFDGEDTRKLGSDIKEKLNEVINACDFKGEDHNQYHIILHAMLKETKKLKSGASADLTKMKAYINAYYEHFEVGELE